MVVVVSDGPIVSILMVGGSFEGVHPLLFNQIPTLLGLSASMANDYLSMISLFTNAMVRWYHS